MKQHNQYLNEILSLITRYHEDKKIQNGDLDKIDQLVSKLGDNPFNKRNNNNSKFLIQTADTTSGGINIKVSDWFYDRVYDPEKYRTKFNDHFNKHPKLDKMFKVKSTFFNDSLAPDPKKNIVLQLVEHNGEFQLAYLNDAGGATLVNENATNLTKAQLGDAITDFNKNGIGSDLDKNFRINTGKIETNTRKITIPFKNNFDDPNDFTLNNNTYITFLPGIIHDKTDPYYHQFTLLMFFDNNPIISKQIGISVNEIYYDTFQLCPPC